MTMVEEEESRKTVKQCRVEELQPGVDRGRSYSLVGVVIVVVVA